MKRIQILIILTILFGCFVNAAPIPTGADLEVSLVSQIPDPVEPGEYVDIRFKIENYGGSSTDELFFELLPEYPFSLEPGDDALVRLGNLQARQVDDEGIVIKYRVKVDENAVEGVNEIEVRYKIQSTLKAGAAWIKLEPFDINIQTHDSIIAIDSVTSDPEEIAPGETGTISVTLSNMADSLLKEIRVSLDLFTTYTLSTSVSEVTKPFSPIGSTDEKIIMKIDPHETTSVGFDLMADPDAAAAVYKIPMNIRYYDEVGRNYSEKRIISVIIGQEPDLVANIEERDVYTSGSKGSIGIKFVNKGAVDVKFLYVKIKEGDGYSVIGNMEDYVGNIDSDDFESSDFEIYLETKENKVTIPFEIEYKDANNKDYSKMIELGLPVYSTSEAKKLGFVQGSSGTGFFLILIIVGGGVWWYLRRRKKKKNQKK